MSVLVPGSQLRQVELGMKVSRAAATIPQSAAQSIFSVTVGRILLTSLVGQVTVAIGATATTVSIGFTPTAGTANASGLASATAITSSEVGVCLGLPLTAAGALVVGSLAGTAVQVPAHAPYVLKPGTITYTTSASTTGSLQWDLLYIPLDDGATVAAL